MGTGLLHSAQSLLASVLALARTRLELFSTELQEELSRLLAVIVVAVAALLLAALGAGLAAAALLIALPAEQRVSVAAAMAVLSIAAAVAAGWTARTLLLTKPPPLAASIGELERDREALLARSAAQRARISLQLSPVVRVAGVADRIVSPVRAHPVAFTLAAGLVALRRGRSLLGLLARALPFYSLLRR